MPQNCWILGVYLCFFLKLKKIICFFKHNLGVDKAKIRPIFLNNMQNKAVYFITSDDDFIASNRATVQ